MDVLNKITIKRRMALTSLLMVLLFIFLGVYSIIHMNELGDLTSTLYEHPIRVSNAALRAKAGVLRMHRSMKDVSMSQNNFEANMAIQAVLSAEELVYQNLGVVKERILGPEGKELVQETIDMFAGWKPIRVEVEELVLKGDREAAGRITRSKGADYVARLERKMLELTAYAGSKADVFMENAEQVQSHIFKSTIVIIVVAAFLSLLITFLMTSSILSSVSALKDTMSEITATGSLVKAKVTGNNEITEMSRHFNALVARLQKQFWLRDGQNAVNQELSGELSYDELVTRSINFVSRYVDACTGALYSYNKDHSLCELKSSFAFVEKKHFSNEFKLGEGIVGQVAVEKSPILLANITRQEAVGTTGTVSEPPKSIYIMPLLHEKELYGVLEVASFEEIDNVKREFLDSAANIISISLFTASQNEQIRALLESTQEANEKLQAQTEELQAQTEELQAQTEELEAQKEELEALNEEFQQQSAELGEQNVELETQRQQVEEANRLKSEFLSNMSHELRTPLNSVMALSRVLIMQAKEKLSEEEANYLEIIERNGKQLLNLINDILDLSKIEAGRMDVSPRLFSPKATIDTIVESLEPLAEDKGIEVIQKIPDDLPKIESDESRVHQILQNIIGNAVKFTEKGSVTVSASGDAQKIHIRIKDTGIGISEKDLPHIFDEFRQVDGSSSRSFEGTGLGLTIAYRAAKMLGGDISVESALGKGAAFTVTLPMKWEGIAQVYEPVIAIPPPQIIPERKTILIVDDEPNVVTMISDYLAKEGYNTIMATSGKEALKLAQTHRPFAITLDVIMPEMDGWEVLGKLKQNPKTADIPVIIISITDDRETGLVLGAVGYITKPVNKDALISEIYKISGVHTYSVMVVDDSEIDLKETARIIEDEGIKAIVADGGPKCMQLLKEAVPDVLVLDLMMPDLDGFEVLERIRRQPATSGLPVIVVTAKDLTAADKQKLIGNVSAVLAKSDATRPVLLAEIKKILSELERLPGHLKTRDLAKDARILLVEDNEAVHIQVKAMLESEDYIVDVAENGQKAIEYVKHTIPDGIILDLMMPEVDGFEVLEKIRSAEATARIPVLVLTAKDLTPDDLNKLSANNIQQLIHKGDVDHQSLLFKIRLMLGSQPGLKPQEKILRPAVKIKPPSKTRIAGTATVLVVEDNPDNLTTIKAVLQSRCHILEATDGEEGLKTALSEKPDLVLLDMSLPKMDGFTVVRKIKEDQKARNIPVIALTARAMKGDREEMLQAGCDDYISKPVDPVKLLELIDKWLGG